MCSEGSETIMGAPHQILVGGWDSPFPLETKGSKEPRGLGANPGPASQSSSVVRATVS